MDEASQTLETAENFDKFKDLIRRFLKFKINAQQVQAIANHRLTAKNSYGFALMVKAAEAILAVANGRSTEEYTCFCKFCYDEELL